MMKTIKSENKATAERRKYKKIKIEKMIWKSHIQKNSEEKGLKSRRKKGLKNRIIE